MSSHRKLLKCSVGLLLISAALFCWRDFASRRREEAAAKELTARGFSFTRQKRADNLLWNLCKKIGIGLPEGRIETCHYAGSIRKLGNLRLISELRSLRSFTLIEMEEGVDNRSILTDEFLDPIDCGSLEFFVITSSNSLTDRFFKRFAGNHHLEVICIDESSLSDDCLRHLESCTNLKGLTLSGSRITIAGVAIIAERLSLENVFLERTNLKADTLAVLSRSKTLQQAWLCDTAITVDDAVEFTKTASLLVRVGDCANPVEVQQGEAFYANATTDDDSM